MQTDTMQDEMKKEGRPDDGMKKRNMGKESKKKTGCPTRRKSQYNGQPVPGVAR